MTWLERIRRLRRLGVLGMNRRNTQCILDLNPRAGFPLVDGKRQMADLCVQIGVPTPELYAVLSAHSALRHLPRLLVGHEDFVIKPNRGAAGRGILVIVGRKGDTFLRHNGECLTLDDLRQHVSEVISGLYSLGGHSDEALVQQRVVPHPSLEQISFQGTADIRVIVYKHVPAAAMLRLPTRLSGGRANLHQGAIGAGVDVATGITRRAVLRNRVAECHPDTGASIVGFQVPYWPVILQIARQVSEAVQLGYLGVDVVLDRAHGPLLLEANARPGLAIQIANGQGLLRRFEEIDRFQGKDLT
jgi:alpha-L-glutamate ligase-like protein